MALSSLSPGDSSGTTLATLLQFAYARCLPGCLVCPPVWADENERRDWREVLRCTEEAVTQDKGAETRTQEEEEDGEEEEQQQQQKKNKRSAFGEHRRKFEAKAEICRSTSALLVVQIPTVLAVVAG